MEKATVISLLEKYWQAETTIAEEEVLAAYFQGDRVDPELQAYSDLFSYFHEEARVSAGPGFGNRILQRLGLPLDEEGTDDSVPAHEGPVVPAPREDTPIVPMAREPFRFGVAAAAAAIILLVGGLFLLKPPGQPTMHADTRLAARIPPTRAERAQIADTYDDPEQALAAVRRALLIASKNLNQGRREITGSRK
jgi:hypothetical protein